MQYKVTFLKRSILVKRSCEIIEAPSEQAAKELFRAGHPQCRSPLTVAIAEENTLGTQPQALPPQGCEPDQTALHLAVCRNQFEYVDQLLETYGWDADTRWVEPVYHGSTPLHTATQRGHLACMEILFKRGANPNLLDGSTLSCLMISASRNDLEATALLLEHGANPNAPSRTGCTPLMFAAANANPQLMSLLIEHGAEVAVSDRDGKTPLHYVMRPKAGANASDFLACVHVLVDRGHPVDVPDRHGMTPFHLAMRPDKYGIILADLFMDAGADPFKNTGFCLGSPVDLAEDSGRKELALHMRARAKLD